MAPQPLPPPPSLAAVAAAAPRTVPPSGLRGATLDTAARCLRYHLPARHGRARFHVSPSLND